LPIFPLGVMSVKLDMTHPRWCTNHEHVLIFPITHTLLSNHILLDDYLRPLVWNIIRPLRTVYHFNYLCSRCRPGSSVGIATGYGLSGSGDRIPVGTRFSSPVQTGPWAHQASCTMGNRSFAGVKSGRGVTLTPYSLLVPLVMKE
jgi:hypothetical protein